ncbi:uncharacterized protein LOC127800259 isoform X2 [Diospyros lotus]|uniref:uncharacterized protein LOC127800259 isoform X2 n=1 Tax=Diospyros lotus TaxID=55363 RepID=UPI00225990B2|nr:uncharacterized protein LOC127800259 isoform X2 [Diospyros lotus]
MAEEEIVAAPSPVPLDHKRKHEELEPGAPKPPAADSDEDASQEKPEPVENADEGEGKEEAPVADDDSDESEAKRPRLEQNSDGLVVTENGVEKIDKPVDKEADQPTEENKSKIEIDQQPAEDDPETVNMEEAPAGEHQKEEIQQSSTENQIDNSQPLPPAEVLKESSVEQEPVSDGKPTSRKMEVPNTKVGVLIGKAGDTIRFLQINSGAKIQITRDVDADPSSSSRAVELIGTLESISKAEKLIKDVIAEAEAGGSPALVARGFNSVQAAGAAEQILMQVPNEKVGLIIGKGGETIKSLQTRSGARIQLMPQHVAEGEQCKERTVRVSGDKKQIEIARDMIKEVMSQPARPSLSGGYNQQVFRPRGPAGQPQWGPRGYPAQAGYDYQQRGPYQSQNSQYPPQAYGNYPPQQVAARGSFGPGWEQRPSSMMQGATPQSGGYDYYGGQGHMSGAPTSIPLSNPVPAHGSGPSTAMGPHSHANYNYGQPHAPEYGQPAPYSQSGPPPQGYVHGYNETKYENQAASHPPYSGYGGSQPGVYPQGTHPGYAQDQYGKPPSYGMPPLGPPSQHYGQPRASQPGDILYQGPVSSTQPYGQTAPSQQGYPYSSGPMQQQSYPPYGSSTTDGYNQMQPPSGSAPVYPQQGGQPISGYGQPGGPQALGYAQGGPTGGYMSSYPSSQPGYTEQPAPQNNLGYGYQGAADPGYVSAPGSAYGAPPTGQAGYAQPAQTQPGYDQSVPQSGGYGNVAGGAPVGHGKSLSPQSGYPQYDSTQMYGAQR